MSTNLTNSRFNLKFPLYPVYAGYTTLVYGINRAMCFGPIGSRVDKVSLYHNRAWNNSQLLTIFQPIFTIWLSKSNLLGQIYCTFPMGKPLIVYSNAPAFKEWPTNFKLLFQALPYYHMEETHRQ